MTQYIDKSALVTEIEKELNTTKKYSTEYVNGKKYALKKILSFLDTLEVKSNDVFIEKACEGINHLLSGYIIRNFHFGDSYDIDRLIEDFKKYMKGE